MKFEALEISLQIIRSLRGVLAKIRSRDPKLFGHIRGVASSAALNLGEGRRRVGKDRLHHYRIAAGSADEVLTALRVAEAWGYVTAKDIAEPARLLDKLLAILWTLTN